MEQRATFEIQATPSGDGFEIAAMTAGAGNGWNFSADVLRRSAALWEGVEVFVDHTTDLGGLHSLRDLGGVFYNARFDEMTSGIVGKLRPCGPSAALERGLGREMLAEVGPKPRIRFSGDVGFTAEGKDVKEILRVFSADLVFDPARGGAFLRALNAVTHHGESSVGAHSAKEGNMPDLKDGAVPVTPSDVENLRAELNTLFSVEAERKKSEQALAATRVAMCEHLLNAGLSASDLPVPMVEDLRVRFANKIFEPKELTEAIQSLRMPSSNQRASSANSTVRGVTGVRSMFDTGDQLQAAVDDLLQAPRNKGSEGIQVARLSGIKELYLSMTGDRDFYGGYYPERAMFQHTTASFPGLVKNALNKALVEHWDSLGKAGYNWWEKVATVEHFDTLNAITWLIFGTVGALPSVAEGGEYTELKIGDSPETSTFTKYGGYVGVTLEALDRDDTRKLRAIPRELANGALRNISALVAALFTDGTGYGPTLADTGTLFNASAVTGLGGHANYLTTALGTDYAQWNTIALAMYNQPMLVANEAGYYGTGKKMAIWPKYCIVPGALRAQAEALFMPRWASSSIKFACAI